MEESQLPKRSFHARGFTLLEMVFAIAVFAIGMVGLASMLVVASRGTTHSRYMSMAAFMANEKLEDLSRLSSQDPTIQVPSGSVGSLTSDASGTPVSGVGTVYYYDDAQTSTGNGSVTEVRKGVTTSGADCLELFTYSPNQAVTDSCLPSNTAPTASPTTIIFHRRWMIESPVTVNGVSVNVRRITVVVTLSTENASQAGSSGQAVTNAVTFQMSTIRS